VPRSGQSRIVQAGKREEEDQTVEMLVPQQKIDPSPRELDVETPLKIDLIDLVGHIRHLVDRP
jgi:hypothetical protein